MTNIGICALSAMALWLKMFLTAAVQGIARLRSKRFARPEDQAFFGRSRSTPGRSRSSTEPPAGDDPLAVLGQLALRNDVENIPMFLFVLFAFALLDGDSLRLTLHATIYCVARAAHTLAYLRPTQPLRNIAFQIGMWTMVSLMGHVVWLIWA